MLCTGSHDKSLIAFVAAKDKDGSKSAGNSKNEVWSIALVWLANLDSLELR